MKYIVPWFWVVVYIASFAALCYTAYYFGELVRNAPLFMPIAMFISCVVSIVIVFYPIKSISRNIKIWIVCIAFGISAIGSWVLMDSENFHLEPFICNIILNGNIKSEEYDTETDEGESYTATGYEFIPATKVDKDGQKIIDALLLEIGFTSILFPYFLLRYKLNFNLK